MRRNHGAVDSFQDQQKSSRSPAEGCRVSGGGVHQVEIIKLGQSRLVSPAGQCWDEFFVNGPRASEDFMSEREQPSPEEREPL
jgi:virulence-associated protein VagC